MSLSSEESSPSEKRLRLIENYMNASGKNLRRHQQLALSCDQLSLNDAEPSPTSLTHEEQTNIISNSEEQLDVEFASKLLSLTRDQLDESSVAANNNINNNNNNNNNDNEESNERLLETGIRYALAYLEEYDYAHKLTGLRLLDHLIDQVSPTRLKLNMRAELVRETLARYVNDKDSLEFLDKSNELMIKLLGIIETKFNTNEHYFKQTSAYVDSALSNCYMSTNTQVKAVYLKHLKTSIARLGPCACRHLDKQLTVLFDSIELGKVNADFQATRANTHLVLVSLDLMHAIIQACFYRIHSHSRRIIQFLLKLVYSYCLQSREPLPLRIINDDDNNNNVQKDEIADDDQNNNNNKENFVDENNLENFRQTVCLKSLRLVKMLFRNDRIRCSLYDDFKQVKSDAHLNRSFLKLIENI